MSQASKQSGPSAGHRVSIITAMHDASKYVEAAIESCLAQTYPSRELIIVDDASTDDSVRVAQGCTDSRVRLLRNPENRGPGSARNRDLRGLRPVREWTVEEWLRTSRAGQPSIRARHILEHDVRYPETRVGEDTAFVVRAAVRAGLPIIELHGDTYVYRKEPRSWTGLSHPSESQMGVRLSIAALLIEAPPGGPLASALTPGGGVVHDVAKECSSCDVTSDSTVTRPRLGSCFVSQQRCGGSHWIGPSGRDSARGER